VCLTRCESNRDSYGTPTHPFLIDLHTGKGCQIPECFSSPQPNGEFVLASTGFTAGSIQTVPPFSSTREKEEIIIYERKEERKAKF